MENTKITLATFKKFISTNANNLLIKNINNFDGMIDGLSTNQQPSFNVPDRSEWALHSSTNTLDIRQLWLVGQSRDFFTSYEDELYTGIEWSNCCGNGVVAVLK